MQIEMLQMKYLQFNWLVTIYFKKSNNVKLYLLFFIIETYLAAVGISCGVALGMSQFVKRSQKLSPFLRKGIQMVESISDIFLFSFF